MKTTRLLIDENPGGYLVTLQHVDPDSNAPVETIASYTMPRCEYHDKHDRKTRIWCSLLESVDRLEQHIF